MHQFKSSASPYLCEVTIDVSGEFGNHEVKTFLAKVEQGISVFGYTPGVLLVAASEYQKWESIGKLLSVLHEGKVAICGAGLSDSLISKLRNINKNIQLNVFEQSQIKEAKLWLLT